MSEIHATGINLTEELFDSLYPIKLKKLSGTHWTPVEVAKKAISFLGGDETKAVLDIGSGAGKFCFVAASISTCKITGVEQRDYLVQISRKLTEKLQLQNLNFIHDDLQNIDFSHYHSFYFFNSFEENISLKDKLSKDHSINSTLRDQYIVLIRQKFEVLPMGTRIVTYCGEASEIPANYHLVKSSNKGKLKFWEKVRDHG